MMAEVFLQRNCRGFLRNYVNVYSLLDLHDPLAFGLQETDLNDSHSKILRHYQVFHKNHLFSSHSSGGVAILAQRSTPRLEVPSNRALKAVAVRVPSDRSITVCSL